MPAFPSFPRCSPDFAAGVGGAAVVGFVNGVIIAKLKVPAFIVTLGTSFITRGVAYLMSENTTVIGLPAGIRAYGNDALIYFIPAWAAASICCTGRRSGASSCAVWTSSCPTRSSRPPLSSPGRCSFCTRPSSAGTPTPSAAAWTRPCAAAFRSIATSSSSTSFPPRPPASPAFFRPCASPPARR